MPSITLDPTPLPTSKPSAHPTRQPTRQPTFQPFFRPTRQPTRSVCNIFIVEGFFLNTHSIIVGNHQEILVHRRQNQPVNRHKVKSPLRSLPDGLLVSQVANPLNNPVLNQLVDPLPLRNHPRNHPDNPHTNHLANQVVSRQHNLPSSHLQRQQGFY